MVFIFIFCSSEKDKKKNRQLESSTTITTKAKKEEKKDFELKKIHKTVLHSDKSGTLKLEISPESSKIYIAGKLQINRKPFIKKLKEGKYDLQVISEFYKGFQKYIEIKPDKENYLKINLEKETIDVIKIRSNPEGAKVYFDSVEKGKTPLSLNDVECGHHLIKVQKKNGKKILFGSKLVSLEKNDDRDVIDVALSEWEVPEEMEYIKPRYFTMAKGTKEYPSYRVHISGFYIDKYEVTNEDYEKHFPGFKRSPFSDKDKHPVTNVTWFDAQKYCMKEGKRLPTEAEWEYAARGPYYSVYAIRGGISSKTAHVDRRQVKDSKAALVGTYKPNTFGLYDMTGNAKEWVFDWYDENYYQYYDQLDPLGPDVGLRKVIKGGCWWDRGIRLPAYNRDKQAPSVKNNFIGFRCVKSSPVLDKSPKSKKNRKKRKRQNKLLKKEYIGSKPDENVQKKDKKNKKRLEYY